MSMHWNTIKIKSNLGVIDALKSLKDKNICFNPRPFSNPIHLHMKQVKIEQMRKESFLELHFNVVEKVDALIAQMEQVQIPETINEMVLTHETNVDVTPGKFMSDIERNI